MQDSYIASDLTRAVLRASTEALAAHFKKLFRRAQNFGMEQEIARRLEQGSEADLSDFATPHIDGFPHEEISRIFYEALHPLLRQSREGGKIPRGIDRHIWSQDYDRWIRSLFPTGQALNEPHTQSVNKGSALRTRVSLVVQQALLRFRQVKRMEKATTASRGSADIASIYVPSPFYIAREVLTDPDFPSSEVYATAALRMELLRHLQDVVGEISFTHQSISRALEVIRNRSSTSKSARSGTGEASFIRQYLAMRGIYSLQIEWSGNKPSGRPDLVLQSIERLFDTHRQGDARSSAGTIGFWAHPDHVVLPDASELLNELQGLPLPIEGATSIFHGGLRFAGNGDIVAAISGSFGAGKTSACLSLAAALAPLGCRTLFLSCEEEPKDIEARLIEAIPDYITRSTPLFSCVRIDDFRDSSPPSWFRAHKVRARGTADGKSVDVATELRALLHEALETAPLFSPFRDSVAAAKLPPFARQIIVVDGFHQLFQESSIDASTAERSLRELIDQCRKARAVFIFTIGEGAPEMLRLDYLCDVVIELCRRGFDRPEDAAGRVFKLLKARRQPTYTGAHLFHIAGRKSFRVKLNVTSHAARAKGVRWVEPDPNMLVPLSADQAPAIGIRNHSQVLVYGRGSSGKAGLGLYILHRKPIPAHLVPHQERGADLFSDARELPTNSAECGELWKAQFYESRTLVISFLYQAEYYNSIRRKFRTASGRSERLNGPAVALPDRAIVDTISLYPGALTPEDFLAKIENRLTAAELRGIPYTGVLIDGIHNVFVQFPVLENEVNFWPQLYNLLRRRALTVVTTHTEFELADDGSGLKSLSVDLEHAQRKAAPLLSALVSAADYVFELSAHHQRGEPVEYLLAVRSMLGDDPPVEHAKWDRLKCRLEGWRTEPTSPVGFRT